jgi:hypothetical protein
MKFFGRPGWNQKSQRNGTPLFGREQEQAQKVGSLLCRGGFKLANGAAGGSDCKYCVRPNRLEERVVIGAVPFFLQIGHRCGEFTNVVAEAGIFAPDALAQFTQRAVIDASINTDVLLGRSLIYGHNRIGGSGDYGVKHRVIGGRNCAP